MMRGVPPLSKTGQGANGITPLHGQAADEYIESFHQYITFCRQLQLQPFNLEQLNFPNSALFQRFSVKNAVIHGNSRSQTSPEAAAS